MNNFKEQILGRVLDSSGKPHPRKVLALTDEQKSLIKSLTENCVTDSLVERLYWMMNDLTDYPKKCLTCGCSVTRFYGFSQAYKNDCCSQKCASNSKERKKKTSRSNQEKYGGHPSSLDSSKIKLSEKNRTIQEEKKDLIRQTNLERYGVENPYQAEEVKKKIRKSHQEKYGVDNPMKNPEIVSRGRYRSLAMYGTDHPIKSSIVKETLKRSFMRKFGVDNPLKNPGSKQKLRETNLLRYGSESPLGNDRVRDKIRQTNLEKYGFENAASNAEVRNRIVKTKQESWLPKKLELLESYVTPLFNLSDYQNDRQLLPWKCSHCGDEFGSSLDNGKIPLCFSCFPIPKISTGHLEILDYIKSLIPEERILANNRSLIYPLELDIYIPDHQLTIEFNGLYWHSESMGKDRNYHLNKTEKALEKGVQLLHVFEDEWMIHQSIVKSRISSILGKNQKIFARKCEVREVPYSEKRSFLEENHIQGNDSSKISLGLYYNDELVSIMTFGKSRFNKKYEWELFRYSNKNFFNVIGGASRLLVHFERNYHPSSLVSYCDRRYSIGRLYKAIGFSFSHHSSPGYFYVNPSEGVFRSNRQRFQKHKLKEKLEIFSGDLSEIENMVLNGYSRIWDCGHSVFYRIY